MHTIPAYVGPCVFGIRIGVVTPKTDLPEMITAALLQCDKDKLLDDGDVICITESIVARAQNNFVSTADIATELREKHGVKDSASIGVLFPIASRNRFAPVLQGFAQAVPRGELVVQLSFPRDEVGNAIVQPGALDDCSSVYLYEDIKEKCAHPVTNINYPGYYKETIERQGARAKIVLSNDAEHILSYRPDCLIVANVHNRAEILSLVRPKHPHCLALQDLCSDRSKPAWSEWGLLGSNMSSAGQIKLAPREGDSFAHLIRAAVEERAGKHVEVIIYGDGAYKDPATGIYELADPQTCFGCTDAFKSGRMREGIKYKLLADTAYAAGKSEQEIEKMLREEKQKKRAQNDLASEGTTPRTMVDVIASLADLVSGSADAGTPLVLVKGLLNER